MLVLYNKSVGKADYRLGRVTEVHPDIHGRVRTVTVGLRRRDKREAVLSYRPKPLDEITLGVQRIVVISPVKDQVEDGNSVGEMDHVSENLSGDLQSEKIND